MKKIINTLSKSQNILAGILMLCLVGSAQAEIFQCRDTSGQTSFQNKPCEGELSLVQPATQSTNKHFLWQAKVEKGTLYLLGSIHFGKPEMYPLPAAMMDAFHQANTVVVEANVLDADPTEIGKLIAEKAMYGKGKTLQQQLGADTWKRLNQAAGRLGIPIARLNQQKPWFVSMTLTGLALNRMGFKEERGIDQYFLGLAAQERKKIVELESLEWQLSLFDQLTSEEQVLMLEESLRELEYGKAFFDRMLTAWQTGDAKGIQALFDEGLISQSGSKRLHKLIMTDRNHAMVAKLEKMARRGGVYLVVVGAGHMTGDEGIIALLEQQGYQVLQK